MASMNSKDPVCETTGSLIIYRKYPWRREKVKLHLSMDVSPQALHKPLLPNMQTLCLRATLATEVAKAKEDLSHLALWSMDRTSAGFFFFFARISWRICFYLSHHTHCDLTFFFEEKGGGCLRTAAIQTATILSFKFSADRGFEGRRRPVASRAVDSTSTGIGMALPRVSLRRPVGSCRAPSFGLGAVKNCYQCSRRLFHSRRGSGYA
ncbi:hypothetical protein EDB83DRAFT_832307 [Lactarius deliciosus]|nr:hypothetical protein EDB83DRAFT_832307 [Lactarius deliciosus]